MAAALLLILEDHPVLRQSVVPALKSLGRQDVCAAAIGLNALQQRCQSGSADIVICDFHMPEMDGLTILRLTASEQCVKKLVIRVRKISPELHGQYCIWPTCTNFRC